MPRIDTLYAFVAEDTGPDDEGVIGMLTTDGWLPLVGADMARIDSVRIAAEQIARDTGKRVKLLQFTNRVEMEEINP